MSGVQGKCHNIGKWKHSVNWPFTKCLNNFQRWTIQLMIAGLTHSCLLQDLVMRWSLNWGCCHFLSFMFGVDVGFGFLIFQRQVNACTVTVWPGLLCDFRSHYRDHVFYIFPGKYHWSFWQVQSDMETNFSIYRFRTVQVRNNCHYSERYMSFIIIIFFLDR